MTESNHERILIFDDFPESKIRWPNHMICRTLGKSQELRLQGPRRGPGLGMGSFQGNFLWKFQWNFLSKFPETSSGSFIPNFAFWKLHFRNFFHYQIWKKNHISSKMRIYRSYYVVVFTLWWNLRVGVPNLASTKNVWLAYINWRKSNTLLGSNFALKY